MYSLLVHGAEGHWNGNNSHYDKERFNTFSSDELTELFTNTDTDTINKIKSLPCIFAYESRCKMNARLGWIEEIRVRDKKILFKYIIDQDIAEIPYNYFDEYTWDFDIENWEMNRNHWAFKNVDLRSILVKRGLLGEDVPLTRSGSNSIFTKPILSILKSAISELYSHSQIDGLFSSYKISPHPNAVYTNKLSRVGTYVDNIELGDSLQENSLIDLLSQVYLGNKQLLALRDEGQTSNPIFEMGRLHDTLEDIGLKWSGTKYIKSSIRQDVNSLSSLSLKSLSEIQSPFSAYKALEVLGEGGSGRVFKVESIAGEQLALKILAPEKINSDKLNRFRNEVFFSLRCIHINLVKILDIGFMLIKDVKCPYYVMPLYAGSFRDLLTNESDFKKKLRYYLSFLEGLIHAHQNQCWHRDIKPENILFDAINDVYVLSDFGIAHINEELLIHDTLTKEHSRLANFQYASPEQRIVGGRVGKKSDIYSCGLILNEIFTGAMPWGANHKRVSDFSPDFSDIDEIIDSMIQHDEEDRIDDLQKVYNGVVTILEKVIKNES